MIISLTISPGAMRTSFTLKTCPQSRALGNSSRNCAGNSP